jgi:acetylglutamate kinase
MNRVVVKIGGHALDSLDANSEVLRDLASDVLALIASSTSVVLVHGGGPQIAELLASVGAQSRFHEGLRITDVATMGYVAMALGHVNVQITAALNVSGLASVGISGADAKLLCSRSLGDPWHRAGDTPSVHAEVITSLWSSGFTPVVSSIAVDDNGELLNCNADTVAGALAGALQADVLVLLSDIDQVRRDADDPSTSLASATAHEVDLLIATGAAREGMRPKMAAALDALGAGAARVIMANGTRRHALRGALDSSIPTTEVVA